MESPLYRDVTVIFSGAGGRLAALGCPTASAAGLKLTLTRKESAILEYLLLNRGRPVSQEELIDHVWDNSVDNFSNSIRVHISALRKKLRSALGYDPIRNRIGEGYVMEDNIL